MGLGILDGMSAGLLLRCHFLTANLDRKLPHIPGTVLLNEESAQSQSLTGALRHGSGRDSNIILAPQPSEDPNDPLNWSSRRKEMVYFILVFGVMLNVGVVVCLLSALLQRLTARVL